MSRLLCRSSVVVALMACGAWGQSRTEFEAASIRASAPVTGFHFGSSEAVSGGPGTEDPGMFRCSHCTLATLIKRAFDLRNYQLAGRAGLGDGAFDVMAKVPAGATREEFQAMLQNLLKERFGLASHMTEKSLRGYRLVVGKNGAKLQESTGQVRAAHGASGGHSHDGLTQIHGSASFRGDHKSMAELAGVISDQLGAPVEEQTGLKGSYDITLNWTNSVGGSSTSGGHTEGGWTGGGAGHGGGPAGGAHSAADGSGPTLFEALQSQLGLKLVPSEQTTASILVIDRVKPAPTDN